MISTDTGGGPWFQRKEMTLGWRKRAGASMTTRALLLLKQAVKCRLLANGISRPEVATRLLDLADEYQALAVAEEASAKSVRPKIMLH
jgi:hypothetical protein